ncbi:hypothetical protein TNCV_3212661 [Trichonephila clavipes]|nr:hypothetical protein TNCV_3212661 [Trichonephila clavipes]
MEQNDSRYHTEFVCLNARSYRIMHARKRDFNKSTATVVYQSDIMGIQDFEHLSLTPNTCLNDLKGFLNDPNIVAAVESRKSSREVGERGRMVGGPRPPSRPGCSPSKLWWKIGQIVLSPAWCSKRQLMTGVAKPFAVMNFVGLDLALANQVA